MYPVGTIYLTVGTSATGSSSPAQWLGGTWEMLPEGYALWTNNTTVNDEREGDDTDSTKYRMKKPGLPNIKGDFTSYSYKDGYPTSVFSSNINNSSIIQDGPSSGMNWVKFYFDATRCSGIYGNSDTVQPPAYKVYAWKRIA